MQLGEASRGKIYGNRAVLELGEGKLENGASYRFEALGLTIQPESATTAGRVAMNGANRIQVSAERGSLRVLNGQGVLVANIFPGRGLELEPLKSPAESRLTGTIRTDSGRLLLTDETTNVTMELAGQHLGKQAGNRVSVSGSADAVRPRVLNVTQIAKAEKPEVQRPNTGSASSESAAGSGNDDEKDKNKKKKAAPAAIGGAAAGGAVGGILGMSVTTVAIVGGVAAAGTLGGLAASNKLPGQSSATGTASR